MHTLKQHKLHDFTGSEMTSTVRCHAAHAAFSAAAAAAWCLWR